MSAERSCFEHTEAVLETNSWFGDIPVWTVSLKPITDIYQSFQKRMLTVLQEALHPAKYPKRTSTCIRWCRVSWGPGTTASGPSSGYLVWEVRKKKLQHIQRKMIPSRIFAFHNIIKKDSVSGKQHNLKKHSSENKPVFRTITSSADPKQPSYGEYLAEMWFCSLINILWFDIALITINRCNQPWPKCLLRVLLFLITFRLSNKLMIVDRSNLRNV